SPTNAFTSVDFPVLGRPTTATTPDLIAGRLLVRGGRFRLRLGHPRHEHARDPPALHPLCLEPDVVVRDLLALAGDRPEQVHHEPADRVPFLLRELHVELLVQLVDGDATVDAVRVLAYRDHQRFVAVVLVGDLADQ